MGSGCAADPTRIEIEDENRMLRERITLLEHRLADASKAAAAYSALVDRLSERLGVDEGPVGWNVPTRGKILVLMGAWALAVWALAWKGALAVWESWFAD